jgi:hypothetical protein
MTYRSARGLLLPNGVGLSMILVPRGGVPPAGERDGMTMMMKGG